MSIETAVRQGGTAQAPEQPLLDVVDLVVRYGRGRKAAARPAAVDGVSFSIRPGETVGLVGESGSGKSTIGKAILGLEKSSGGSVSYNGTDITHASPARRRELGGELRAVFQDPNSSLNPRQSIGTSLAEPLRIRGVAGREARQRAEDMLARVGLPREAVDRFPGQFSGGQRQRIAVARALICEPKLVVCDEAVSALDLSTQAQVLNLLADLRDERGLSYLFIAHDISVVQFLAQRVVVLYRGQVMESGPAAAVTESPQHPFTQALVAASPVPRPAEQAERRQKREALGVRTAAAAAAAPGGCPFSQRCPLATDSVPDRTAGPAEGGRVRRRLPLRLSSTGPEPDPAAPAVPTKSPQHGTPHSMATPHKNGRHHMTPAPWSATMIAPDRDFDGAPLLRKEFRLDEGHGPVKRALLRATAFGIYEAQINGVPVGEDVLSPGWSTYEWRLRYRSYDVTALVGPATVLGVSLGNGWYRGRLAWNGQVGPVRR